MEVALILLLIAVGIFIVYIIRMDAKRRNKQQSAFLESLEDRQEAANTKNHTSTPNRASATAYRIGRHRKEESKYQPQNITPNPFDQMPIGMINQSWDDGDIHKKDVTNEDVTFQGYGGGSFGGAGSSGSYDDNSSSSNNDYGSDSSAYGSNLDSGSSGDSGSSYSND